ncbi:MAG: hypothetical protein IIA17_03870 [candidate division Zixibacteria bacterium]|nr:hypothetical protein [candidate division Zixibacteria bacterium]
MNKSTFVIGGLLIFFGLFFLMESIGLFWFDFGEFISFMIPFGLIAFGVWLIIRKKDKESKTITVTIHADTKSHFSPAPEPQKTEYTEDPVAAASETGKPASPTPPPKPKKPTESSHQESSDYQNFETTGRLRYNKVLGDMFIDCKGRSLSNVEISVGLGDLELILNEGILSKGLNRVVISGFVGDIRIFISKETAFFCHCSNFIGDIDLGGQRTSGLSNTLEYNTPGYDQAESKLYVAANSFLGDIRVYQM